MKTEDYGHVSKYVRTKLIQQAGGKSVNFPPVLSISANLIDLHNAKEYAEMCEPVVVSCDGAAQYDRCRECSYKKRQFYKYHNGHASVFKTAAKSLDRLPGKAKAEKNVLIKFLENWKLVQLEGDFLLAHYEKWRWDECIWPHESYENILTGLFFFCPKILWCAVSSEIEAAKRDIYVIRAIKKCLELYVLLDGIERSYKEENCYYAEEAARIISDSHLIEEIAVIALEKESERFHSKDRLDLICQLAEEGLQFMGEMTVSEPLKGRHAVKVLGRRNYRYLRRFGESLYR